MYPVYRDDGLMVGWYKDLPRKKLDVHVWQILIDGKKPTRLPGSQDDKIVVETVAMKNRAAGRSGREQRSQSGDGPAGQRCRRQCEKQCGRTRFARRDQARIGSHRRGLAQKRGRPQRPRRRHRYDPHPPGGMAAG